MEILLLTLFSILCLIHLALQISMALAIHNHSTDNSKTEPSISVLVAAHNELENLKQLLPILCKQAYGHFEIIIVLNRCTDESEAYLRGLDEKNLRIIVTDETIVGIHPKKQAIQKGIEAAKNDWILLTDADCRPSADWVSKMAQYMTKEMVIGLSPYERKPGFLNQLIQYETFQTALHFVSAAARKEPYMALGRNIAYKKSLFQEMGGFGETKDITGGDDDLLVQRMLKIDNYVLALEPSSRVDSLPKTSWASYFKQKTRHLSVGKYYPKQIQFKETFRWFIHSSMWLTFLLACFPNPVVSLVILLSTFIFKAISINIVADRLEKRFNHLWLPFVDLVYAVLLPLIGLRSLLVKNIKWN